MSTAGIVTKLSPKIQSAPNVVEPQWPNRNWCVLLPGIKWQEHWNHSQLMPRSCITMTERVSPSFTIHGWAWLNSSTIRSISLPVIKNQFWVKWPKSGNSFWTFSFVSAPKLFPFLVESFVPVSNAAAAAAAAAPPPMAAKISGHESGWNVPVAFS